MTPRGITLDLARRHIGDTVVYDPGHSQERGVIVSVNERYVFVRYRPGCLPQATSPRDLHLAGPEATS